MNSFLKINLKFVKFAAALDESAFAETDNTLDQVDEMDAMVKGAASSAQGLTNYLMNQDKGPSRENVPGQGGGTAQRGQSKATFKMTS